MRAVRVVGNRQAADWRRVGGRELSTGGVSCERLHAHLYAACAELLLVGGCRVLSAVSEGV